MPERSQSTHALPPKVIGNLIAKLANSRVYYLGIQVVDSGFGETISVPVRKAGSEVIAFMKDMFMNRRD